MSNVLPESARQSVWRMYRARFCIAACLVFLAVAALAFIALVPSYFTLYVGGYTSLQGSPVNAHLKDDRAAVAHAQALLGTLSPLLSATTTSGLIADAISARPATVEISHITSTAGRPGTIILVGSAGSIKAISAYQNALRADPHFTGVSVPVGDLAGTAEGQFSITLSAYF